MRNEPFVGLESVPMETRSRRSGPFHLDLYSARLLLGSTAKKSTADSFLSPSPRNSISAFFQRRISSSFLSLFSFFLPFLYFSPSISFLPSRTPSSPTFPSPPPEVSTGLWIFSGNVSNRFMVFSCILKIHQLYSLPIGTTPIVSSLRFHNSTRRLRSKCELVYFLSRSITSRLPFFLSLCLSLSLIIVVLPLGFLLRVYRIINSTSKQCRDYHPPLFLPLFCTDHFWFVWNWISINKPKYMRLLFGNIM